MSKKFEEFSKKDQEKILDKNRSLNDDCFEIDFHHDSFLGNAYKFLEYFGFYSKEEIKDCFGYSIGGQGDYVEIKNLRHSFDATLPLKLVTIKEEDFFTCFVEFLESNPFPQNEVFDDRLDQLKQTSDNDFFEDIPKEEYHKHFESMEDYEIENLKELDQWLKSFESLLQKHLTSDYDYQSNDEAIKETILANDYDFDEDTFKIC